MTSSTTSRLISANSSRAVKAPVRSVCTSNITASGLSAISTIDGSLTPVADDRFLLAGQTSSVDNGIYIASSGTWTRASDFNASRDIAKGTLIVTEPGLTYRLTSANPITIGTTALTFTSNDASTIVASLASTAIGAGASLVGTNDAGGLFTSSTAEGNLQECVVTGAVNQSVAGAKTFSGAAAFTGTVDLTAGVIQGATPFVFEGGTPDAFETSLAVTDPTADRTVTLPNADGTIALRSDAVTATTEVVSSASETTVYTKSIVAGTLGTNAALRLTIIGDYFNNSGANRDLTVKGKYGATTFFNVVVSIIAVAATRKSVRVELDIHAKAATNAQVAFGTLMMDVVTATQTAVSADAEFRHRAAAAGHNAMAIDSTAAADLVVTVQHSASDASLSFKMLSARLELLK